MVAAHIHASNVDATCLNRGLNTWIQLMMMMMMMMVMMIHHHCSPTIPTSMNKKTCKAGSSAGHLLDAIGQPERHAEPPGCQRSITGRLLPRRARQAPVRGASAAHQAVIHILPPATRRAPWTAPANFQKCWSCWYLRLPQDTEPARLSKDGRCWYPGPCQDTEPATGFRHGRGRYLGRYHDTEEPSYLLKYGLCWELGPRADGFGWEKQNCGRIMWGPRSRQALGAPRP